MHAADSCFSRATRHWRPVAAPVARRRPARTAWRRAPGSRPPASTTDPSADAYAVIATAGIVPPCSAGARAGGGADVAVLVRHADVAEEHVGTRAIDRRQRFARRRRGRHARRHTGVSVVCSSSRASSSSSTTRTSTPRRSDVDRRVSARAAASGRGRPAAAALDDRGQEHLERRARIRARRSRAWIVPPCSSTSCLAMARPRPRPPCSRLAVPSACRNGVEHVRQELRLDARAGVLHRQDGSRRVRVEPDGDRAVRRRELHRVRQQVPDDLLQPIRVARRQRRPDVDVHRRAAAAWPARPAARSRPRRRRWPPGRPRRTCSRSLPVTMRETSSRSSISRACARALRSMLSRPRACVAGSIGAGRAQHAGPAEHGVQRRPQLVRQRGQELVLQPVGVALALQRRRRVRARRACVRRLRAASSALAFDSSAVRSAMRSSMSLKARTTTPISSRASGVGAERVVAAGRDPARRVGQVQQRLGDRALHPLRERQRRADRQQQQADDDAGADRPAGDGRRAGRATDRTCRLSSSLIDDRRHDLIACSSRTRCAAAAPPGSPARRRARSVPIQLALQRRRRRRSRTWGRIFSTRQRAVHLVGPLERDRRGHVVRQHLRLGLDVFLDLAPSTRRCPSRGSRCWRAAAPRPLAPASAAAAFDESEDRETASSLFRPGSMIFAQLEQARADAQLRALGGGRG